MWSDPVVKAVTRRCSYDVVDRISENSQGKPHDGVLFLKSQVFSKPHQ